MPIEKELKYELDEAGYRKLLRAVKSLHPKTTRQQNYYFDDPKLTLKRSELGLRLRISDSKKAVLTLKAPVPAQKGPLPRAFKARLEFEAPLIATRARPLVRQPQSLLNLPLRPIRELKRRVPQSTLKELRRLGTLATRRTTAQLARGLVLEIDSFLIFHTRFYELEVETPSPLTADKKVRELLAEHGIRYRPCGTSKLARFFKEWQKKRKRR